LQRLDGVISVLGERQGQPAMPPAPATPPSAPEQGPVSAR